MLYWGVGSAPSREKQIAFGKLVRKPRVLFCEQLCEARQEYRNPSSTLLWTHYLDEQGTEVEFPPFATVTSKGGASNHHAIVCRSNRPIRLRENVNFDVGLFGNFQGNPNIANQQTAPIVEINKSGSSRILYRRGFWADLAKPNFVTLTRNRRLTRKEAEKIRLMMGSSCTAVGQFKQLIRDLKTR